MINIINKLLQIIEPIDKNATDHLNQYRLQMSAFY